MVENEDEWRKDLCRVSSSLRHQIIGLAERSPRNGKEPNMKI
jgi:hypothetical protein